MSDASHVVNVNTSLDISIPSYQLILFCNLTDLIFTYDRFKRQNAVGHNIFSPINMLQMISSLVI